MSETTIQGALQQGNTIQIGLPQANVQVMGGQVTDYPVIKISQDKSISSASGTSALMEPPGDLDHVSRSVSDNSVKERLSKEKVNNRGPICIRLVQAISKELQHHVNEGGQKYLHDLKFAVGDLVKQWNELEEQVKYAKIESERLSALMKQVSENAKIIVAETQLQAEKELKVLRESVQKATDPNVHMKSSTAAPLCDAERMRFEELKKKLREARRSKMVFPSKVTELQQDIENLNLRISTESSKTESLQEEVLTLKLMLEAKAELQKAENNQYEIYGEEILGSFLTVMAIDSTAPSICKIQWFRILPGTNSLMAIPGATAGSYAPEPLDVACVLQVQIESPRLHGSVQTVSTSGPIAPALDLDAIVDVHYNNGSADFKVLAAGRNRFNQAVHSAGILTLSRDFVRLRGSWKVKAKESYGPFMKMFGGRGQGTATSPNAVSWIGGTGWSYTFLFNSALERNAALTVARKFAQDRNVSLRGPNDPE